MTNLAFGPDWVLLDASCILDLYTSGRIGEILAALPHQFAITEYACQREGLTMYCGAAADGSQAREPINLQPFVDQRLFHLASLSSEGEERTFIRLAVDLDDEAAATGAIALHRSWAIASDDRKVQTYFAPKLPRHRLLSTPALLRQWVTLTCPPDEWMREVVHRLTVRAKYDPPPHHPLYEWWCTYK